MAFTTPPGTPTPNWIDGTGTVLGSRIRAVWLNYISGQFPNALDAIGGGYYQLAGDDIRLSSNSRAFILNFPDPSHKIELRGHVAIDVTNDANLATGQGAFAVNVSSTFAGPVSFTDPVSLSDAGTTFSTSSDVTSTFAGPVSFTDPVSLSGVGTTFSTSSDVTSTFAGPVVLNGTIAVNNTVTLNQPIQQTGADGFISPSHEDISAPAADFDIDGEKNYVFIGAQSADVVGTLTFAGGGLPRVIRVVSRAMTPGFKIDFEFVAFPGTTLARFPTTGTRAWVDFYYNGLTWEVGAHGGGTVVF
jgi:hypothetical protein